MKLSLIGDVLRAGALVTAFGLGLAVAPAQTDVVPLWQKAAGGHSDFDVASVRLDKGEFRPPTFALSADDWFREPNGRFFADFTIETYLEFAYKLWLTDEERHAMLAALPGWVNSDRFAIEATAPLHATKDQYRLMMQALLAERFGVKLHVEQREMPVLAMTLIKPGKTGPKLIPHDKGVACEAAASPEVYPPFCYGFSARPKGKGTEFGSRNSPMDLIGKFLGSVAGGAGEISRPVVDQTGLIGRWDYTLEVAQPFGQGLSDANAENQGPTVIESMQEQLGIRLKSSRALIPVLIVDQVKRPTEN
ncbi:uncharacterized protein (TIGR03435 family) [Granulicella aggregans]|uniref:Uncharacterized protein (TIGR03435 family) n=1 Tax=Granulicella aggregans TaxID=474949 RepID=A0A7W7ZKG9_9BACT|nr:TIGR03435 family protein [Granulicella aggregans]MBB5061393.1 uncharacterized protein (TIGR03435 family) [Granulicella aggregans]